MSDAREKYEIEQAQQRDYYARTADQYDNMHYGKRDEHQFALALMRGLIDLFNIKSILDIGSGTGRALIDLKAAFPDVLIIGIEPAEALRRIGHAKGIPEDQLIDGDAQKLPFVDGEFDLVCEFATLHHIPKPRLAVAEMLRVSRVATFISDSNCYGQGSSGARFTKRLVRRAGLWPLFNHLRTRGKGHMWSESDGLFYSYSVLDDYAAFRQHCATVHVINTTGKSGDPFRSSSHVAMLGLKDALLTLS